MDYLTQGIFINNGIVDALIAGATNSQHTHYFSFESAVIFPFWKHRLIGALLKKVYLKGNGSKSHIRYMTKGFLIHNEIFAHFLIY